MTTVIGIFEAPTYEAGKPLRAAPRFVFENGDPEDEPENEGYFDLIAPLFEDFAQRDTGMSLKSMHILVSLSGNDLQQAVQRTDTMIRESGFREKEWLHQFDSDEERDPQQDPEYFVNLSKRRLIAILRRLCAMFSEALSKNYCVVLGNGMMSRIILLGESVPPGTELYS